MFDAEIARATANAGQLASAMRSKFTASETAATDTDREARLAEGQALALQLTEANVKLTKLRENRTAHAAADAIAEEYLAVDPAHATLTKAAANADGGREKLVKAAQREATVAFYRSGGDVTAAREVCKLRGLQPNEVATLIAADTRKGGIFVMPELGEMRTNRMPPPVMRSMCDVQTTNSDTLVIPLLSDELETPNIVPEGYEHTDRQDIDFGGVEIKIFDWHPKPVVVSQKLLRNTGAKIEQIIGDRIQRRKDLDEDDLFLNGDGAGEPYGLMRETSISSVVSQSAAGITWAGILNWIYTLPEEWANGAEMLMRRLTYAAILGTADPAGHYLFNLSAQAAPNTVLGIPVKFSGSMPAIGADTYPAILGWFPAYTIVDGPGGVTVKRLEEKFDPNIGFSALSLIGGRCVETAAFIKLKCSL